MRLKNVEFEVKLLRDILKLYSPTGCESELGRYLSDLMNDLGFDVYVDSLGSVIGTIGEGSPKILLCGHMDTVPGEMPVKLEGYKLYGRGAVDAKPSLAAMLMAAYQAVQEGVKAEIKLACLVDEEGKSRGAKNLPRVASMPDYAVFGEPSGTDNIIIGYKGSLKVAFDLSSRPGHSASSWLYTNAIEEAFELWRALRSKVVKDGDSYFNSVTGCLTRIRGGGKFSTTPSRCLLEVDVRLPPGLEWGKIFSEMRRVASEQKARSEDLEIETVKRGAIQGVLSSKDSPLVAAYSIAIRRVRGKQPILLKKTGTSDMNILAQKWDIPMIAYGAGDSKLDHTQYEHTDIRDYISSIEVHKRALKSLKDLYKIYE